MEDDADGNKSQNEQHAVKILSEKYGLMVDDNGNIYSRTAKNEEEQRELDSLWLQYLEENGMSMPQESRTGINIVQDEMKMERQDWEIDEENERNMRRIVLKVGSKRSFTDDIANEHEEGTRCHYYGCSRIIKGVIHYAPHPDGGGATSSNQPPPPDLEYPFCSLTCVASWAEWEIGEPLSRYIRSILEKREGCRVDILPDPSQMLVAGMGGMKLREQFTSFTEEEILSRGHQNAQIEQRRDTGKVNKMAEDLIKRI